MVWVNCNLPAPAGTCNHTPIVPMLPDLSNLAGTTNLGGAANPSIAAQMSGSGGNTAQSEVQTDIQDDSGGLDSTELQEALEGLSNDLASNPWVNPSSLNPGDPEGS
jgi:hypothetical protein